MPKFDDNIALEKLQPFFDYGRSLGDGAGEAEVMAFMLTIMAAINQEMKYDTVEQHTGNRAQDALNEYFALCAGTLNQVIEDLQREADVRKAEVIAGLTDYQRDILGLKND